MNESLTSKTFHGLKWSYISTITNAVLQIGFTAVMARLLEPRAFGLVAMAGVVLRFGSYFAQMGVAQALIQKKDISNEDIRAAFTSTLILGLLFFALAWAIAPFAIYIFDNSEVIPVIRVMAFSFVLTGLSTTALSLLRRNLKFRSLAIIEISSYALGYGGVGVRLAYSGFGVWSLVVAALSQSALSAILSYLFSRHDVSFMFFWKYYKELYSFGSRVSIISFFEFIGSNLDTLAIGHFLGANLLGIYNRAFMLVNLPIYYLTTSFSRVLFPSFSRIQLEIQRLKKAYLSAITLIAALIIPVCIGIMVASREIVLLILGEKWSAAIPVLQILAIAVPISMLSHFGGIVCDATANLNSKFIMQVTYVILLVILFFFFRRFGLTGFATAIVVGELLRNSAYLYLMKRVLKTSYKEMFSAYQPGLINGFIVGGTIFLASLFLHRAGSPVWLIFSAQLSVGFLLLVFLTFIKPHQTLKREIKAVLLNLSFLKERSLYLCKFISWYQES